MRLTLDRWFLQMTQVRGRLTRLLAQHDHLRVDGSEGVNDDLALDGLDWILKFN